MKLDLIKEDLVCLAKGIEPNYSAMDNNKIKRHGSFNEPLGWKWKYDAFKSAQKMKYLKYI
ncbi:MAG: hypothetical protein WCQ76_06600 [Fusobacterium sp.]